MRKCILSAIAGALAMLILIIVAANVSTAEGHVPEDYEHIDYISAITQEECYVCSDTKEFSGFLYWGEDNVGIVDLNTFELLRLEINRYHEMLLLRKTGFMQSTSRRRPHTRVSLISYKSKGIIPLRHYVFNTNISQTHTIRRKQVIHPRSHIPYRICLPAFSRRYNRQTYRNTDTPGSCKADLRSACRENTGHSRWLPQ